MADLNITLKAEEEIVNMTKIEAIFDQLGGVSKNEYFKGY
jgi:hypothetical protein